MPKRAIQHDMRLFDALYEQACVLEPDARRGAMFGSPPIFVGSKMAGCVFGNEIALKLPSSIATAIIDTGRAAHFTPYGKPKMREWVSLRISHTGDEDLTDLLSCALSYAKANRA